MHCGADYQCQHDRQQESCDHDYERHYDHHDSLVITVSMLTNVKLHLTAAEQLL